LVERGCVLYEGGKVGEINGFQMKIFHWPFVKVVRMNVQKQLSNHREVQMNGTKGKTFHE